MPQMAAPPGRLRAMLDAEAALAHGAWHMANDTNAALVVVWSQSGEMARNLSQNRFRAPIVAFSSDEPAVRRMALLRGVIPVLCDRLPAHRTEFAAMADRMAIDRGLARPGQKIVLLAGMPFGRSGVVNTVAIRTAGELAGQVDRIRAETPVNGSVTAQEASPAREATAPHGARATAAH